jgi:hypothetical protein
MVLNTHQFLQPLINSKSMAKKASDEDSNVNIFEMTSETSEHSKKLVRQELDLVKRYPNIKDIKCPLDWWAKHESMFPIVALLAH